MKYQHFELLKLFWFNRINNNKNGIQPTYSLLVLTSRECFAMMTEYLSRGERKDLGLQEWRISSFILVATITQEV